MYHILGVCKFIVTQKTGVEHLLNVLRYFVYYNLMPKVPIKWLANRLAATKLAKNKNTSTLPDAILTITGPCAKMLVEKERTGQPPI